MQFIQAYKVPAPTIPMNIAFYIEIKMANIFRYIAITTLFSNVRGGVF